MSSEFSATRLRKNPFFCVDETFSPLNLEVHSQSINQPLQSPGYRNVCANLIFKELTPLCLAGHESGPDKSPTVSARDHR